MSRYISSFIIEDKKKEKKLKKEFKNLDLKNFEKTKKKYNISKKQKKL